jgi:hypothetical protein
VFAAHGRKLSVKENPCGFHIRESGCVSWLFSQALVLTLRPLTAHRGEDLLTWFRGDFLARAYEAQRTQIQFLDKGLNDPNWIIFADVIVQALGK